ncbi:4a-hydroxytetrahydrobiopterin dehydratase [Candidatus Microgenomates bacterium]|nr:4a-hydroxytetrahydrobiopterin dehydratase [Candidatus Microgenomates bacterium]
MDPVEPAKLSTHHCVPCEGGVDPLTPAQFAPYMEITKDWKVAVDTKSISREFAFKDFKEALSFVNKVGDIAESEGHHPDINMHSWNKVLITLSTHAIHGLSVNDFVLASKIDLLNR